MDKASHSCCDKHDHAHAHEQLFGKSQETPAVFSHSFSFDLCEKIPRTEFEACLVKWLESIKQWARQNKYFIGHIKAFAEDGNGFDLWISTTGGENNVKSASDIHIQYIDKMTIHITAIIFGTDLEALQTAVMESLNREILNF